MEQSQLTLTFPLFPTNLFKANREYYTKQHSINQTKLIDHLYNRIRGYKGEVSKIKRYGK